MVMGFHVHCSVIPVHENLGSLLTSGSGFAGKIPTFFWSVKGKQETEKKYWGNNETVLQTYFHDILLFICKAEGQEEAERVRKISFIVVLPKWLASMGTRLKPRTPSRSPGSTIFHCFPRQDEKQRSQYLNEHANTGCYLNPCATMPASTLHCFQGL